MERWEEGEGKREVIRELKRKFYELDFPNRNYMMYFSTYFPEQVREKKDKYRIRNTWRETTLHDDIIEMMKYIVEKLEEKFNKK